MIDYGELTKESILSIISEEGIYKMYLKSFQLNKSISCPWRKDQTPSFSLFYNSNGRLLFKDHAYNETGDCFTFVMRLFNINFRNSLIKIKQDASSSNHFNSTPNYENFSGNNQRLHKSYNKSISQISIQYKSFQNKEYKWWSEQGISPETLNKFNVRLADVVYINNFPKIIGSKSNPCYVYEQNSRYRFYLPLNTKGKRWFGNMISSDIQGIDYIPNNYNGIILIQKSYKDLMSIDEQLGIKGVCKPGEGYKWVQGDIDKLKLKSSNLISNFDYDYCGVHNANNLKKNYNIPYIFMSNLRNQKRNDYTDNFRLFGKQYADTKLLTELKKLKYEFTR